MKDICFEIIENTLLTKDVVRLRMTGDTNEIVRAGQFVNFKIDNLYLRRPISVCDLVGDCLTVIFRKVGKGTAQLSKMKSGDSISALCGLGNGFDTSCSGDKPLLIGGGVGVPPLYLLAKRLTGEGRKVNIVLGFNKREDIFYEKEFSDIGCNVTVATADGSRGIKGFATDAFPEEYSYFYACGPEQMLRAVSEKTYTSGQMSFEARMGCGFGACMGCSCKTLAGTKRICKDGPVMRKEEIIWSV